MDNVNKFTFSLKQLQIWVKLTSLLTRQSDLVYNYTYVQNYKVYVLYIGTLDIMVRLESLLLNCSKIYVAGFVF